MLVKSEQQDIPVQTFKVIVSLWGGDTSTLIHTHTLTCILTGSLVVVYINSVKLQGWVTHIVTGWIDAVLVADDFPELDVSQLFCVSLELWSFRFSAY